LDISQPYWIVRVVAGLMIITGQICFFVNIYKTYRAPATETPPLELASASAQ